MHISSPGLSPETLPCHLITSTCVTWNNRYLKFSASQIKVSSSIQSLCEKEMEVCTRNFWFTQNTLLIKAFRIGTQVTDNTITSICTCKVM